jgi:predicted acetyltransferase
MHPLKDAAFERTGLPVGIIDYNERCNSRQHALQGKPMSTTAPRPSLELHEPNLAQLPAYAAALEQGWSPNNTWDVSKEELDAISADPVAFIRRLTEEGGTVRLPDGSEVPKLPMHARWMWDGDFVGRISLRWQPGTDGLPEYVLGHIGFAVVPWKRRRGYATRALALMLEQARAVGLTRVEITADIDNIASQGVILANRARLVREFVNSRFGTQPKFLYVIDL